MAKVTLTANLGKYFPQNEVDIEGNTLLEVLENMEKIRPHFMSYILEDNHSIRHHVNIFIDGELYRQKSEINVSLKPEAHIHIMQALSGG